MPSHIRRLAGGHVRVGLEADNHCGRGVLATNEMLVERTVHIMEGLNLGPASPAEARDMLDPRPMKGRA